MTIPVWRDLSPDSRLSRVEEVAWVRVLWFVGHVLLISVFYAVEVEGFDNFDNFAISFLNFDWTD